MTSFYLLCHLGIMRLFRTPALPLLSAITLLIHLFTPFGILYSFGDGAVQFWDYALATGWFFGMLTAVIVSVQIAAVRRLDDPIMRMRPLPFFYSALSGSFSILCALVYFSVISGSGIIIAEKIGQDSNHPNLSFLIWGIAVLLGASGWGGWSILRKRPFWITFSQFLFFGILLLSGCALFSDSTSVFSIIEKLKILFLSGLGCTLMGLLMQTVSQWGGGAAFVAGLFFWIGGLWLHGAEWTSFPALFLPDWNSFLPTAQFLNKIPISYVFLGQMTLYSFALGSAYFLIGCLREPSYK